MQYQLGKLYLGAHMTDKAMGKADLILKKDPANSDGLQLKGAVLVAGKSPNAEKYLSGLVEKGIKKPDVYLLLAMTHMQKNDARGAEDVLKKGMEANDGSVEIKLALADLYARSGRGDDAAALLQKVIALQPDKPSYRMTLATLYYGTGNEQKAVEVLNSMVAAAPGKEESWIGAAGFYIARHKYDEAEKELKEGYFLPELLLDPIQSGSALLN